MSKKVQITGLDTNAIVKLSKKRCEELMAKIKDGDKRAKDEFIMGNLRLVLSVIKRFHGAKVSADDMFQAGCIGLIKAVRNFDTSVGVCFSTYAVPMISGEIKRIIRTNNGLRIARSIRDRAYQALKVRGELERENLDSGVSQVAQRMQVAEAEVAYALDAISDTFSLYDPVYNKAGDTIELLDQLKDEKNTEEEWTEKVALQTALEKLDKREKTIIKMRYFEGKTQTEISSEVGLSQAQVSRIEKVALLSMRKKLSYS
ncbi:MAG: sigma-70 family RNA polymerase sigma factor [Clostridia bacterium]|nr:sigma-70 family RNA polymerase sigma factor [Clostridia bacterium]